MTDLRSILPLLLLPTVLLGCSEAMLVLSPLDSGVGDGPAVELTPIDPGGCGFEDYDLADFGHPGEMHYLPPEGGKVVIVEEGANYSALVGEEAVVFHGDYALLLRSNDEGDPESLAVVRTLPFVPQNPLFVIDQLSEVGPQGISLGVRVLSEGGELLYEEELEVVTGGFVPELLEEHDPIEGFPEIDQNSAQPGDFTRQYFDMDEWYEAEELIMLEFWQHTLVESNGFFTLFDNLCDGEPMEVGAT
ncbi:MAG: hypothetical protein VX498_12810 [Myxococcota bacterium]|nr:hypothetical protein [Myxococcota bacterium]